MSSKQEVKLILASTTIGPKGYDVPIFTLRLRYWRAIHAEFMTHRAFNRNAGSSRAIPVQKMLDMVVNDTAGPQHWGLNQKGMQAENENGMPVIIHPRFYSCADEFEGNPYGTIKSIMDEEDTPADYLMSNQTAWRFAAWLAAQMSKSFSDAGYHKQIANRITEPYQYMNVVVTATDWENFFALRCHPKAMPELRILAEEIEDAIAGCLPSNIQRLQRGEWHVPFIQSDEHGLTIQDQLKLSTARCASTSYQTVEGLPMTPDVAHRVFNDLVAEPPIHASPAEHQAKVSGVNHGETSFPGYESSLRYPWLQYRKFIEQGATPFLGG